jgi:hypothetical protein
VALAELGQEVANRNDFHETMRTSLHLLLGSIAIMRGGSRGIRDSSTRCRWRGSCAR